MGEGASNGEEPRFDGIAGPFQGIGLPQVRTLSDEYRDTPEPEDSERIPPPEPPGLIRRITGRLQESRGKREAPDR